MSCVQIMLMLYDDLVIMVQGVFLNLLIHTRDTGLISKPNTPAVFLYLMTAKR